MAKFMKFNEAPNLKKNYKHNIDVLVDRLVIKITFNKD